MWSPSPAPITSTGALLSSSATTALNANDWFLNRSGTPKPVLNSNQYGGTLGGPIKKDKLFFFVSYQETDQKNGFSAFSDSTTILPPIPSGNRGTCGGGQAGTTIAACDAAGKPLYTHLASDRRHRQVPKQGTVPIQNPATCLTAGNCDAAGLFNINPIAINLLQLKLPDGSYIFPARAPPGYVGSDELRGSRDLQGSSGHRQPRLCD